jgi:inosose dehydratase
MIRRDFLAGALALPLLGRAAARVAPRFGYAAITWGGQDEAAIDDIASLGFRGIQLRVSAFERWARDPAALNARLAERGLTFVAFSSGVLRLDPSTRDDDLALHLRHARFTRDAGGRFLQVVDERPRDRPPTARDFEAMARRLDELGRHVADLGVTLAYHNHMGNLGQSPDEVASVLSQCDPQRVRLLLDIAHWQAAGGDPVAAVRQHAGRLAFLHLKDVQRTPADSRGRTFRFVELGEGSVDVRGVMSALATAAYDGWGIVELDAVTDPSRTPRSCALISKDFLASIGYTI